MVRRSTLTVALVIAIAAAAVIWKLGVGEMPVQRGTTTTFADVVPAPHMVHPAEGVSFTIRSGLAITTEPASAEVAEIGAYLAELLGLAPAGRIARDTGPAAGATGPAGGATGGPGEGGPVGEIALRLGGDVALGDEGYHLEIAGSGISIRAHAPAGLFWGVQTLRQLLPPRMELPVAVAGGEIIDRPRFPYRGVMLDVARHFFDVAAVKRLIDLAAMYKVNYLHLHLTDDQGWRIAIDGWPRLTTYGGGTEVGGGSGGYYSKDDYREIVRYAASHYMTVVPEVDLPGHTNAALASYPELACDGKAPDRYTGIEVGFSALCASNELTYRFLDEVFGELAALTPGEYLHIGGDEALTLSRDDYATMVLRAQEIVVAHGKTALGWHEVAAAKLHPSTVVQYWGVGADAPEVVAAAASGNKVIMSPADRAYLDMKYDESTRIGLSWAGTIGVEDAYAWDPAQWLAGVGEAAVLGVESPLWTETVTSVHDIEYLAFPRLVAIAEIGWSPASRQDWSAFRLRLGAQAPRWEALGVDFFRAGEVPWAAR